jgi:hypothetical protein
MTRIARRAAAPLVLAALLTGCGVTVYEPGVYKGPKDPLLELQVKPEHKAQLQERFTEGQAER